METVNTSLGAKAYDALEELIVRGELPSNQIVSEASLGRLIGLGRTPVHEAVIRLEQEGLVRILPRKGILIVDVSAVRQLQVLEVRRPLERLLAECAAVRGSPLECEKMLEYADQTEVIGREQDAEAFFHVIKKNHQLLELASNNELIKFVMNVLHAQSRRFWFSRADGEAILTASRLHANLLRSVASREPAKALQDADKLVDYLYEFCKNSIDSYML